MMIYDRTQYDVSEAKKIISSKVKFFQKLTEDEINTLERGIITTNTINRIEQKQKELYDLFVASKYFCPPIQTKNWKNEKDFFLLEDFERIISNGEILRNAFFVLQNTPTATRPKYHFENINAIEKLLYDLDENYKFMASNWRECGTFECGEN